MHDVTLVYTEYNHRLEVWVLGKRAANTTADRQQYTNTSKVCDDTMSMGCLSITTSRNENKGEANALVLHLHNNTKHYDYLSFK